jgi:hypothetical protein
MANASNRLRAEPRRAALTGVVGFGVVAACSALASGLFAPRAALAFSDPETFKNPVSEGGGNGRYFTGSPADGYTCSVCHEGAEGPDVEVYGLPLAGYAPGSAYEVTIDWADDLDDVALSLELTSRNGTAAGTLRLPPDSELFEPERCVPVTAGIPAGALLEAPARSILTVPNCGAQRVRFLWTAPTVDVGPVWFSGSLVRGDGKGDVGGDGVTDFAGVLTSPAVSSQDAVPINGSCSAAWAGRVPHDAHAGTIWIAVFGSAYIAIALRHRRRLMR